MQQRPEDSRRSWPPTSNFTRLGNRSTLQGLPALRYALDVALVPRYRWDFSVCTKSKWANSKSFRWRTFSILLAGYILQKIKTSIRDDHELETGVSKVIDSLDLTEHDHLVLNTANDFVILATASALQDRKSKKLNIHAIFHFATNHADTAHGRQRNAKMGQQMNMALGALGHHQVYIHTTTEELKAEINSVMDHEIANAIPYPTRSSETTIDLEDQPCNAMLAGMPRSEKGKHSIRGFLQALENRNLIGDTTYRPCLQVPGKHWKSLIPNSLHSSCDPGRVELITKHLSTIEYHQWIGRAGLGIFLYDPIRYRSRCSGVLLEMLTRGVPVIVPDHCWLASQFKHASMAQ